MAHKFICKFYTLQQLSEEQTARALWRLLDGSIASPVKFDSIERAKKTFEPDDWRTASSLYESKGALFVQGENDGFLASFMRRPGGWAYWSIWLDLDSIQGTRMEGWLDWIFRLVAELPVLYGLGCSEQEYDAKHVRVRQTPGGGSATGAVGVSVREFYQYLPGLYWLSIFGKELVGALGDVKIQNLPGVRVTAIAGDQRAVRLTEPVVPEDMQRRLATERQLADALGAQFFFDRTREGIEFEHVPALREVLDGLRRG